MNSIKCISAETYQQKQSHPYQTHSLPTAAAGDSRTYCGPKAGKIIKKIGPKRAAPPIPEEIEHIATQTQVGNINQYLLKSINPNISEKVVALATAAFDSRVVVVADMMGEIC